MLCAMTMVSCDDSLDRTLYFTGDSIIARWDLSESFPSYICYNNGKSGAGIGYIESQAGSYTGKDVVVMIGTNDNWMMRTEELEAYATRYVNAVLALNAKKVFLYSVLPRDFGNDRSEVNSDIFKFNHLIDKMVIDKHSIIYLQVYDDFMRDGKPNQQLYNDGLHLSPYGYEILKINLENKL